MLIKISIFCPVVEKTTNEQGREMVTVIKLIIIINLIMIVLNSKINLIAIEINLIFDIVLMSNVRERKMKEVLTILYSVS